VADRAALVRRSSTVLTASGALLLVYAAVGWASGALARDRARSAWDAAEARRAVMTLSALPLTGAGRVDVHGAPVARHVIPRDGLDEVVVEGVEERSLRAGPGHLPGSALPGEPGNAVLAAHRDRHFSRLDELAIGDSAVTTAGGRTVRWRVTARRVVERETAALFTSSEPRLTLTTCWPVRYLGPAPDRLIVTLEPAP
jgi:LPXTG-site transpeptidase (sortase) family protein